MKLVDIFWHSHVKNWLQQLQDYQEKQQEEALNLVKMEARTTKEDVEKIKAMKTAVFGTYICRVPIYHCGRYKDGKDAHVCFFVFYNVLRFMPDKCTFSNAVCCALLYSVPLPASEAHPLMSDLEKEKATWNIIRVHGQHLTGDMIPVVSIFMYEWGAHCTC